MRRLRSFQLNPWRELSVLMVILMEVCWVTPWFRSLTAATYGVDSWRVFLVLISLVLCTYLLIRIMDYLRLKKNVRRWIMLVFVLVGILVGLKSLLYAHQFTTFRDLLNRPVQSFVDVKTLIPAEFLVILTILVAFWRGLAVAQAHIDPSTVIDHFVVGIVMYVVFIFANTLVTGETPGDFFFLFVFCALVAMCTSRMTILGTLRGGINNRFNRFWLVGIIVAATCVVVLSALLGSLLGNQFSWVGNLLLGLMGSIIVLIWLVISPAISLLITLLGNLFNSQKIKDLEAGLQNLNRLFQGLGKDITDLFKESALGRLLEHWGPTLKMVIFIAIIAIIIFGILTWMAIQLWQDRARRRLAGEQKSDVMAENLLQQLLNLLRQGWDGAINSLVGLTNFNQRQKLRVAARIRQVYADLMDLCASLNHPRDEASTPLEFLPELDRIFPSLQPEAAKITEAYNLVRYGQLPETQQEIDQIEAAWKKISSAGRELSNAKKPSKTK